MTIPDLLRRWLGCEEAAALLRELRTLIEVVRARGSYDEGDENLAEVLAAVDDYLARVW